MVFRTRWVLFLVPRRSSVPSVDWLLSSAPLSFSMICCGSMPAKILGAFFFLLGALFFWMMTSCVEDTGFPWSDGDGLVGDSCWMSSFLREDDGCDSRLVDLDRAICSIGFVHSGFLVFSKRIFSGDLMRFVGCDLRRGSDGIYSNFMADIGVVG